MTGSGTGAAAGGAAGLLLAAGASSRMGGRFKLLLPVGGRPMVQRVAAAALEGGLDPVVAVVGHRGVEVADALEGFGVRIVRNPDWREGQGSSLAAGLRALGEDPGVVAAVVLLADEPDLDPAVIRQAVRRWRRSSRPALRTLYADRPGHPVVLGRTLFPSLLQQEGDEGAASLIADREGSVELLRLDRPAPLDVDEPGDYRALLARLGGGPGD